MTEAHWEPSEAPRVDDNASSTREAVVEIVGMIDARIKHYTIKKKHPTTSPNASYTRATNLWTLPRRSTNGGRSGSRARMRVRTRS